MKLSSLRAFLPILIIFVLTTLFFTGAPALLEKVGIDRVFVIMGNCTFFVVTLGSFYLFSKALLAHNTHAFLRNAYGALMLKFFVMIAVAFVYFYSTGAVLNKAGFFTLTALYFLYLFFEVAILMNLSR